MNFDHHTAAFGSAHPSRGPVLSFAHYTLFLYKNIVFPAQAEYSYFSADFRLKIFLYYS